MTPEHDGLDGRAEDREPLAYEPPAIVESTRFESIAASCVYGPTDPFPCTTDTSQPGG